MNVAPALVALVLTIVLACRAGGSSRTAEPRANVEVTPAHSVTAAPEASPVPTASAEPLQSTPSAPWPPRPPSGITTDFCSEAMNALDEETCYALPETRTDELILYLHGIIPPGKTSVQKTNLGTVLANAARKNHVAVLLPRGRRGLAPQAQKDWWGWPTSEQQFQRWTPELVPSFAEKRKQLEALVGTRFARFYVAGSSSGAYFATALALRGGLVADAYAAISGGAWVERNRLATLSPAPFYVGYGRHDTVASGAELLGKRLNDAGWPVRVAAHPLPHGAREVYLDEALAFFRERSTKTSAR